MFEKTDHYQDLCYFLEDKEIAELFGVDFKYILTEAYESSVAEAIQLVIKWGPHIPINTIRPNLKKYFKELS